MCIRDRRRTIRRRITDKGAQLFIAGRFEEDPDGHEHETGHDQPVEVDAKRSPLERHRHEPQQETLESVDHAQGVESLVVATRALHDVDVARVLSRAALS